MDPSPDDVADTMTATYEQLRKLDKRMGAVLDVFLMLEILVSLAAGVAIFYLLHKVKES